MIRASLKNPYAIVAISLIVVILGVVSFQRMEVDVFPEINLPVVAVATISCVYVLSETVCFRPYLLL